MFCYKTQGNYVVCNELKSGTVGWIGRTRNGGVLGSFVVRIRKVKKKIPFSKFLPLVSFFCLLSFEEAGRHYAIVYVM